MLRVNQHIEVETKWPPSLHDIFEHIFANENDRILIKISLNFVPRDPIDYKPALVQIMAKRQTGDKPLSELMMA